MPLLGYGSTGSVLSRLSGTAADLEDDLADEYAQDSQVLVDFLNLADVELEVDNYSDSEHEEPVSDVPLSSPTASATSTTSPFLRPRVEVATVDNACSICLIEFDGDDTPVQLECGHVFCMECLGVYLNFESGDITNLRHELSKVVPVKPGVISLKLRKVFGCKCPAWRCKGVIEFDDIKRFASAATFTRFEQFVLRIALEALPDLEPCPRNCGGYLQDDCVVCSNPDCRRSLSHYQRDVLSRRRQWYKLNSRAHQLFGEFLSTATDVKCCPNCYVLVEKNLGCDNMRCSRCHTSYKWSTAPKAGSGTCWFDFTKKAAEEAAQESISVQSRQLPRIWRR